MKKMKKGEENYLRLSNSIRKENRPPEIVEDMLIKDLERVLKSYFIYQNADFKTLFLENGGNQEFQLSLKFSRFKDIKVL